MLNRAVTFFWGAAMLCGQAPPTFEVASIRPSEHGVMDLQIRGNQLSIRRMDMYMLVQFAFRVSPNQYTVPEWAKTTAYDIEARFTEGATQNQVFEMLQPLLIERFGVRYHRETKERDVYALVVAKGGIKARALRPDEDPTIVKTASGSSGGKGMMVAPGNRAMTYTATTPAFLAQTLMDKFDLPVVDRTNLTGRYHLHFDDPLPGLLQGQGVSYEDARLQAIQEQLQEQGLRIEKQRASAEMLIIDHLERTPTAN